MQKITLKKEGIFFSFWDEQTASWINKEISEATLPISWYLPYSVQLEGDLTVCGVMKLLEPYSDQLQVIFSNSLAGIKLTDIYEALKKPLEKKIDVPMNCVYLFKIGEISPIKDDPDQYLSVYPVMMGLTIDDKEETEESVYHLTSFDVRSWCKLSFGIDHFMEYTDIFTEEIVLDGVVNWMLFEVIHCILSQVSLSMQVTEIVPPRDDDRLKSGPMLIDELLLWIDELDRILLNKGA